MGTCSESGEGASDPRSEFARARRAIVIGVAIGHVNRHSSSRWFAFSSPASMLVASKNTLRGKNTQDEAQAGSSDRAFLQSPQRWALKTMV